MMSQRVYDILVSLKEQGPITKRMGICDNIPFVLNYYEKQAVYAFFREWEHYSGFLAYPIIDPENTAVQGRQYSDAMEGGYMWDISHPYGKLRHDLLDHLIQKFSRYAD